MSTYSITHVHLVKAPGATHDHIARVKLLNQPGDHARSQIIGWIRQGHRFFTYANPPALVYVHSCPFCLASDYITTHPDATAKNNLLQLPKY